jgi:stage II sporulation protein D
MNNKHMVNLLLTASLISMTIPNSKSYANTSFVQENQVDISVKLINFFTNGSPKTSTSLNIEGSYFLTNDPSVTFQGGYVLEIKNDEFVLTQGDSEQVMGKSFTLQPTQYGRSNTIAISNRKYLGKMEFGISNGHIVPINTVALEDYLKGVVHREMPASWSLEALKAQAIAARTYVVGQGIGNIITDTQKHQVYGGYDWNSSSYDRAVKAVDETNGQFLTFNGNIVGAFYSSSNGGRIESATNAWNSDPVRFGYLQAKLDPFDPQLEFLYEITENALINSIQKKTNISIQTIDSVKVSERTSGGYAERIEFFVNGNGSSFTIDAENDLRGSLGPGNIKSVNLHRIEKTTDGFAFQGKGYGHGIGMSQFGAGAMAAQGMTYKEILGFYYEGTTLENIDGSKEILPKVEIPPYDEKELTPIVTVPENKDTTSTEKKYTHTVVSGNTLYGLGRTYGVTVNQLKEWNNLSSNTIHVGMVLFISNPKTINEAETETVSDPIIPTLELTSDTSTFTSRNLAPAETLNAGTSLKIVRQSGDWYVVETKNGRRWVKPNYYMADNLLNLSSKTSTFTSRNLAPAETLNAGTSLKIVRQSGDWYVVETKNGRRWVKPNYYQDEINKTHIVAKGDTLYGISRTYNISVDRLKKTNSLTSYWLFVGQKLIIKK